MDGATGVDIFKTMKTYLRPLITSVAAITFCLALPGPSQAQSTQSGQSSALAVAVSVGAPVALLPGVVSLTMVAVVESGTILSNAGTAIAFIPSAVGRTLMHNEQVTGQPSAGR